MNAPWPGTRALVTGGSGFVGRVVVDKLRRRGADVVVPRSADVDLTDADAADALFADVRPDIVIHLAARVGGIGYNRVAPAELYLANLLMGTHVIEAARRHGTGKTVLVGTVCSYPKFTPVPFREEHAVGRLPRGDQRPLRHRQEGDARPCPGQPHAVRAALGVPACRPTSTARATSSTRRCRHVIPALIKNCVEAVERGDDKVDVWGTGRATREYLYVDDAAEGIVLAAELLDDPEPVNLGTDREISIRETVEHIARLTGFTGELRWDPTKPDGQPRRRVDPSRAEQLLGWHATMPFDEGLARTIEWFLANRAEALSATS